jgi:DNA repair protein RadC
MTHPLNRSTRSIRVRTGSLSPGESRARSLCIARVGGIDKPADVPAAGLGETAIATDVRPDGLARDVSPGQGRDMARDGVDVAVGNAGWTAAEDDALLAVLLGRSLPEPAVRRIASDLLARFGGLGDLFGADAVELARIDGVGPDTVRDLKLVRELGVRLARTTACRRPVLSSWSALVAYARTALGGLPREQFRTLYLDRRNILVRDEFLAEGTIDHAPVYPREVVRRGLELSASALILVHNHPSGDPAPSRADIEMTRRIVEAAKVFDLQVHDHLVIGREGTASFRTLGLM